MMTMGLEFVAQATGGQILRGMGMDVVGRFSTDTRSLEAGDVFVALKGPRFDGGEFIAKAIERGAAGIMCAHEDVERIGGGQSGPFVIAVNDTTQALGDLARAWRRAINPHVVSVTGSSGKTTTKDMIAHVCGGRMNMLATKGNRNNHIGLPLTLLELTSRHEAAVIEMGMNHSGEIRALTRIAEPNIGVLTNVGDAHLGNFESIEELVAAKAEMFGAMGPTGTVVINGDCPRCRGLLESGDIVQAIVLTGEGKEASVRARDIAPLEPLGWRFTLDLPSGESVRVHLGVFGRYQIANATMAAAVALQLGVPTTEIADRLETFEPARLRSRVEEWGGVRVVEDCYNASPSATVAAIESFAMMTAAGRRYLMLGDMAELGVFSEEGHRRVGEAAAESGAEIIVCVGSHAAWIGEEAAFRGARVMRFDTMVPAAEFLGKVLKPGDALLVKGSRVAALERATEMLRGWLEPATTGETPVKEVSA
jgi:UDP-N-acetylmuramoyl-tripeptide--D-alanyl-D-alanine ligase